MDVSQRPCRRSAGVHVDKPLGATSELTVSDYVRDGLGKLYGRMRHYRDYNGQWTEERASATRAPKLVLRLSGRTKQDTPVRIA